MNKGSVMRRNVTRRSLLVAGAGTALARTPWVAAQAPTAIDVAVSVPGPGNSVSTPLELAARTGLDRAAGVSLRLRFVGGGGVALQDLQSGNADFAVFGLPAAMNHNLGSGPRMVALAAIDDLPLYTLMVREDLRASVRGIQDLRGRTIGIHSNSLATRSTSHQLADLILRSHGVPLDSVRYVAAGQSWQTQAAAMTARAVDASMTDEPFGTRMALERIAFSLFSTGNPADAERTPGAGFLRATLLARRDRVEAQPELAARMVGLVRSVLTWIAERPPEAIASALAVSAGPEREAFVAVFKRFPRQYSRDARFSSAQLRDTEAFFRASLEGDRRAASFAVDSMVVDQWAGRKP
jgi:ABC-type nitrate/sulfonate/bicarbonate transport system substrate-binding protein